MSEDCLFCRIVKGGIPCQKVFDDDRVLAFRDINPQAPVHVLVVPKKHIASLASALETDADLLGHLQLVIAQIAAEISGTDSGYRVVANHGESAGQSVFHLHYHLLAGRRFNWPPG